jgi:DegV family protein with EDD domain
MEKIGIVAEETADFPVNIIQKHGIGIVPISLYWPELESIPGENTFQKMRELEKRGIRSFGKTSQPSPKDFLDKYEDQLKLFNDVICITFTSVHSGSYNSAVLAKQLLDPEKQVKVHVVDSLNASGGQALVILKAIELIKGKKDVVDIIQELEEFKDRVHLSVMFEETKWLEASGRISPALANVMRGMARIGIRPVLSIKKGKIVPAGLRTRAKEIPNVLFRQFEKETKKSVYEGKRIRVIITHGDYPEGVKILKESIEKEFSNVEVAFVNIINDVIGAPTGPNTLASAWCEI